MKLLMSNHSDNMIFSLRDVRLCVSDCAFSSEQDPKVLAALQESRRRQAPYAGAFLLKDDPSTDSSSSTDVEKSISELKGKNLLNRLHEVGTLAQVLC